MMLMIMGQASIVIYSARFSGIISRFSSLLSKMH